MFTMSVFDPWGKKYFRHFCVLGFPHKLFISRLLEVFPRALPSFFSRVQQVMIIHHSLFCTFIFSE